MVAKERATFIEKIKKQRSDIVFELPERGMKDEVIMKRMRREGEASEKMVKRGQLSGGVYISDREHWDLICEVMRQHVFANPIHIDDFAFCCQLESEVIRMTINLYKGNMACAGLITSGGTESIFTATYAYRENGKKERGIHNGNVIACETAHVGIDKSCHYLGLELRKIKRNAEGNFNLEAARKAIDSNTLFIYGSSPEYAFGNYDPLEKIGQLCLKYGIGLHNDCCLGSFVNPFIEQSGY